MSDQELFIIKPIELDYDPYAKSKTSTLSLLLGLVAICIIILISFKLLNPIFYLLSLGLVVYVVSSSVSKSLINSKNYKIFKEYSEQVELLLELVDVEILFTDDEVILIASGGTVSKEGKDGVYHDYKVTVEEDTGIVYIETTENGE